MTGRVQDKTVLITGAARGQGRALAVRLAEEGADVIGVDVLEDIESNAYAMSRREDLDETQRLVEKFGRRFVGRKADVRERSELIDAVASGAAEMGVDRVDGVIAQAGICPVGTDDPAAFVDTVSVCYNGVVHTVDAALPFLPEGGSIVTTGSIAAMLPGKLDRADRGLGSVGYGVAKRGVAALVHDLALALASRRIRVNAIHPTNTNTDMLHSEGLYRLFRPDLEDPTREDVEAAFPSMNAMPVGYVEADDIASMGLFLISDESRFVTGMQMRVDAGAYVMNRPVPPPF